MFFFIAGFAWLIWPTDSGFEDAALGRVAGVAAIVISSIVGGYANNVIHRRGL